MGSPSPRVVTARTEWPRRRRPRNRWSIMASMPPTAGGKFQVSNRRFTMEGKVQKRGGGVKIACVDSTGRRFRRRLQLD